MKSYVYEITKTEEYIDGIGKMEFYGIQIRNADNKLAKQKGEFCRADGISPDYNEIKSLKDLMEKLELYPIHLYDVIEDFLS